MSGQEFGNDLRGVPGGAVEKQENGLRRVDEQQVTQKRQGSVGGLKRRGQGKLKTGLDIERTVEMDMFTGADHIDFRCLTNGRPGVGHGGLHVQAHLVHRQNHPVRVVLHKVGHFFSVSACQSAMAVWLGR